MDAHGHCDPDAPDAALRHLCTSAGSESWGRGHRNDRWGLVASNMFQKKYLTDVSPNFWDDFSIMFMVVRLLLLTIGLNM